MIDILLKALTPIVERMFPDPELQSKAKLELLNMAQQGELSELTVRGNVVQTEAKGESCLQRNWRPVTMLTFTGLVVAHWLGFTAENLSELQILGLLDIVKVGLGGYVVGRSAEKVAKVWKEK